MTRSEYADLPSRQADDSPLARQSKRSRLQMTARPSGVEACMSKQSRRAVRELF